VSNTYIAIPGATLPLTSVTAVGPPYIRPETYGAIGDGVHDDTAALQSALNAFAAAGPNAGLFLSGKYQVLQNTFTYNPLVELKGATGGRVFGAGTGRSAILGGITQSPVAVIQRTNCTNVAFEDFDVIALNQPGANTTFSGAAAANVQTLPLTFTGQIFTTFGLPIPCTLLKSGYWYEKAFITAVGPSSVTTLYPTRFPYSSGDFILFGPRSLIRDFQDSSQSGLSTGNRCRRMSFGDSAANKYLYARAMECNGGTGSTSDINNDQHVNSEVVVNNPVIGSIYVGHLNSIANAYQDCTLCNGQTFYVMHAPQGGGAYFGGNTSLTCRASILQIGGGQASHLATRILGCIAEPSGHPAMIKCDQYVPDASYVAASYVQPAVNANVQITVGAPALATGGGSTNWCNPLNITPPWYIAVGGGGFYRLVSVDDATHITVKNLGVAENAGVGATVRFGANIGLASMQLKVSVIGLGNVGTPPSTSITVSAASGTNILTVVDVHDFWRGQKLAIANVDGSGFEYAILLDINAAANTLTLATNLANNHTTNVGGSFGAVAPVYYIDVSGVASWISFVGCSDLGSGSANNPGLELHICDITGLTSSRIGMVECPAMGLDGANLDACSYSFLNAGFQVSQAATDRITKLNGATGTIINGNQIDNTQSSQPYPPGAIAGISAIRGLTTTALGGGAAPTLGTIGGSGPAAAAQNSWVQMTDAAGNKFWLPVWR
jgi:hypothetical protein